MKLESIWDEGICSRMKRVENEWNNAKSVNCLVKFEPRFGFGFFFFPSPSKKIRELAPDRFFAESFRLLTLFSKKTYKFIHFIISYIFI